MAEDIEILIKGIDEATPVIEKTTDTLSKEQKRAENLYKSTLTEVERYQHRLEELAQLYKEGAIEAEKYEDAVTRLNEKIGETKEKNDAAYLKKYNESLGKASKDFKEFSSKAKASTELAGTLASTLGGTSFGQAAGGLAQLTERMSAFSEVSKSGGAGALAFKGGMIAATAVIGFEFGQAIGNAIFQTEKFREELASTREESARLADEMMNNFIKSLKDTQEIAAAKGENATFLKQLETELTGVRKNIDTTRKKIEQMKEDTFLWRQSANHKENIKTEEANLAALEKRLSAMKEFNHELTFANTERGKALQQARDQAEADREWQAGVERADEYILRLKQKNMLEQMSRDEQLAFEARQQGQNIPQQQKIYLLLKEQDELKAKVELEQKREAEALAAAQKLASEKERIAGLEQSSIENLQKQLITMQDGKAAGEAYALQLQGLDSNVANQIASVQEMIDQANSLGNKAQIAPDVQAKESRLLGNGGRTIDKAEIAAREQKQRDEKRDKLLEKAIVALQAIQLKPTGLPEARPV